MQRLLGIILLLFVLSTNGQFRQLMNAITIPGRQVPILRIFENYAASCRPRESSQQMNIDQLASLLQSLQMDDVAAKVYSSLFAAMPDVQLDTLMGKWYTVVESTKVHREHCSIFYWEMLEHNEFSATFTSRQYSLDADGQLATNEGFGMMAGTEPGQLLITTGHDSDPCPYFPVKLGGLNSSGSYEYMILSTPLKYPTMVLARDLNVFAEKYHHECYEFVEKSGFMSPLAALNTRLSFIDADTCQVINQLYDN